MRFLERVWDEHPEYRSQALLITGEPQTTHGLCVNGATLPVLTKPFRIAELTGALANLGPASASP